MNKLYAIVDIETTGGRAERNKITEIGIALHDGEKLVDQWETLINPECPIPYGITELTGINNEMCKDAPKFYEVAKKIHDMTEGAVFVAHNVRFDYSFIREEFARLGFTYSRKTLCTVRLARQSFPGLRSYSLGNLIKHFGISVSDRHRAMADVLATVNLFERCLGICEEKGEQTVKQMLNLGIKEALLPKNLTLEKIHALPDRCGVYYFHDHNGDVVYVGKSINIKKRVAQHFGKKTPKGSLLQQHVHDISYELTGSELVALLKESHEIKKLRPFINRAQRVRHFPHLVHTYTNEAGYVCFGTAKATNAASRKQYDIVAEYPKAGNAKGHLMRMVQEYQLCHRHAGLERGSGACFQYHIRKCLGSCAGREDVDAYNERALAAIDRMSIMFDKNFFLLDHGRDPKEKSVVLVEDGEYRGFGFVDRDTVSTGLDALRDCIQRFDSNPETKRIIRRFLSDAPKSRVLEF